MNDQEYQAKVKALELAVSMSSLSDGGDKVTKTAEKFYKFLMPGKTEDTADGN